MTYKPEAYWEERLNKDFNSVGVGNIAMSVPYNDMLYRVRKHRLREVLKQHHVDLSQSRVLDVGCGTGFFIDCYQEWGVADITGVDITQVSVSTLSQQYPQLQFRQADISDGSDLSGLGLFDVINCFDVMIHIVEPDRFAQALSTIASLLKPGGYFICSDYFGDRDFYPDAHVTMHSLSTYQQAFQETGVTPHGLYPLFRWGFSNRPFLISLFNAVPVLAETLDKYLLPVSSSRVRLGVFRKAS